MLTSLATSRPTTISVQTPQPNAKAIIDFLRNSTQKIEKQKPITNSLINSDDEIVSKIITIKTKITSSLTTTTSTTTETTTTSTKTSSSTTVTTNTSTTTSSSTTTTTTSSSTTTTTTSSSTTTTTTSSSTTTKTTFISSIKIKTSESTNSISTPSQTITVTKNTYTTTNRPTEFITKAFEITQSTPKISTTNIKASTSRTASNLRITTISFIRTIKRKNSKSDETKPKKYLVNDTSTTPSNLLEKKNLEPTSKVVTTIKLNPIRPTPRGLVDMTYLHDPLFSEPCNFNNCKLGKCLSNNTCECVYPAVGQYCDQIDECSVLNCKNVRINLNNLT